MSRRRKLFTDPGVLGEGVIIDFFTVLVRVCIFLFFAVVILSGAVIWMVLT